MTSICNCDTVYKIIGTKNLQKLHKNNTYDYMMLSCECCKKYRDYFYQNYIKIKDLNIEIKNIGYLDC